MITSKLGREFVAKNEWVPRSKTCGWDASKQIYFPYLDYAGKKLLREGKPEQAQKFLTIGIGHLVKAGEDFSAGLTEDQVDALYAKDLGVVEAAVEKYVSVELERRGVPPLEQHEYDALISFAHNCGPHALNPAKNSAIRALIQGKRHLVPSLLLPWDISAGKHDPGLRARRKAEGYLFTHPYPADPALPLIDLMPLIRELNDERRKS